jgi:hypothetical protein
MITTNYATNVSELKYEVSSELIQDLRAVVGVDIEEELLNLLYHELKNDVSNLLLRNKTLNSRSDSNCQDTAYYYCPYIPLLKDSSVEPDVPAFLISSFKRRDISIDISFMSLNRNDIWLFTSSWN